MKLYRNYIYLCLFFLGYIFLSCKSSPKVSLAQFTLKDSVEESITPNPYIARDRSPMDMSYWPSSYPILKMNNDDSIELLARLIYSRPQKRGRVIFGENGESLCAYGKEWRLGANEATEIDFFKLQLTSNIIIN